MDDNRSFREATRQVLQAAGFETETFGSVAEFVKAGAFARIHCLLLDFGMPGIDGLALQECLRSTNYSCPIIFCSGVEDRRVAERALAKGAVAFLRKPVTAVQLTAAVRSACEGAPPTANDSSSQVQPGQAELNLSDRGR